MPTNNERLWLNRTDAAALCDLQPRRWEDAVRPLLPPEAVRGKHKTLRFWAPAVVLAEVQRQLEQAKPSPTDDDPLMNGAADSDGLERYRMAMAQLREADLAERQALLVRRSVIVEALSPAMSAFRGGVERARKTYGNDAGDAINEMVEDFGEALTRCIEKLSAKDVENTVGRDRPDPRNDRRDAVAPAKKSRRVR